MLRDTEGQLTRRDLRKIRVDAAVREVEAFNDVAGNHGIRVTLDGPYIPYFESYEIPPVEEGGISGRTVFSGVSAGTETKIIRAGMNPNDKGRPKLGYEESGYDSHNNLIATNVGRQTTFAGTPDKAIPGRPLLVTVPEGLDALDAVDIGHIGGVSNNSLVRADRFYEGEKYLLRRSKSENPLPLGSSLYERKTVVVGAGVVGQKDSMFIQKVKAEFNEHGNLLVADISPERLKPLEDLGMQTFQLDPRRPESLEEYVFDMWGGADAAFDCSGRLSGEVAASLALKKGGVVFNLSYIENPTHEEIDTWVAARQRVHERSVTNMGVQIGFVEEGVTRYDLAQETVKLKQVPKYAEALADIKTHMVPYSEFDAVVEYVRTGSPEPLEPYSIYPENKPIQIVTYPDPGLSRFLPAAA